MAGASSLAAALPRRDGDSLQRRASSRNKTPRTRLTAVVGPSQNHPTSNRRVAKLYLPRNATHFRCREVLAGPALNWEMYYAAVEVRLRSYEAAERTYDIGPPYEEELDADDERRRSWPTRTRNDMSSLITRGTTTRNHSGACRPTPDTR